MTRRAAHLALTTILLAAMCSVMVGCDSKLPLNQASRAMILHYARVYLAGNMADFEEGMADRGWTVPGDLDEWEQYADDFGYCIKYVAEHGGAPPPPTIVEVRSMGVDRDPRDAFGGVGK